MILTNWQSRPPNYGHIRVVNLAHLRCQIKIPQLSHISQVISHFTRGCSGDGGRKFLMRNWWKCKLCSEIISLRDSPPLSLCLLTKHIECQSGMWRLKHIKHTTESPLSSLISLKSSAPRPKNKQFKKYYLFQILTTISDVMCESVSFIWKYRHMVT